MHCSVLIIFLLFFVSRIYNFGSKGLHQICHINQQSCCQVFIIMNIFKNHISKDRKTTNFYNICFKIYSKIWPEALYRADIQVRRWTSLLDPLKKLLYYLQIAHITQPIVSILHLNYCRFYFSLESNWQISTGKLYTGSGCPLYCTQHLFLEKCGQLCP